MSPRTESSMPWAAMTHDQTILCLHARRLAIKHARFMSTTIGARKACSESGSHEASQGEAARWSGASRVTKDFAARPTRSRWSEYDASEARSVHRESLWNPKRERAGLANSPRCQSPLAPSFPASCRRPMRSQSGGRGEPHDALLTCHDAPTSGNLLARCASLNGRLRSAQMTGLVRSSTPALARADRPDPNVCTPCVELFSLGLGPERSRRGLGHRATADGALAT